VLYRTIDEHRARPIACSIRRAIIAFTTRSTPSTSTKTTPAFLSCGTASSAPTSPRRRSRQYGLVKPLASFDPFWANLAEWARIAALSYASQSRADAWYALIALPEWLPGALGGAKRVPPLDAGRVLFDTMVGPAIDRYVVPSSRWSSAELVRSCGSPPRSIRLDGEAPNLSVIGRVCPVLVSEYFFTFYATPAAGCRLVTMQEVSGWLGCRTSTSTSRPRQPVRGRACKLAQTAPSTRSACDCDAQSFRLSSARGSVSLVSGCARWREMNEGCRGASTDQVHSHAICRKACPNGQAAGGQLNST